MISYLIGLLSMTFMAAAPRNRMVVLRLSQDEYQTLRTACERDGGRNLSEFARSKVLDYLNEDSRPDDLHLRFAAIEQEVAGLKVVVTRLNRRQTATRSGCGDAEYPAD